MIKLILFLLLVGTNGCTTFYCHRIGESEISPRGEYCFYCGDIEETFIEEFCFDKTEDYKRLVDGDIMNHFKLTVFPFRGLSVSSYVPLAFKDHNYFKNHKKEIRWKFTRK